MSTESQWTVYRTRFLVRARQLTDSIVFTDALGREQRGRPGDYLVESAEGFFSIQPRAIFEDVYVPLDLPPSGQQARGSRRTGAPGLLVPDTPSTRLPAAAWSG
jgi:hypothetical protein